MLLLPLASVFLLAAAPVGGLGAAIPTGIALGIHPLIVIFVAVLASMFPALVIPPLCRIATRRPSVAAWVERHRTARARRFFSRYGVWGMATIGRFIVGPYGSALTIELFGVERRRALTVFMLGSLLLSLCFAAVTLGGLSLLRSLF